MMTKMGKLAPAVLFFSVVLAPLAAWADEPPTVVDGRLESYGQNVTLQPGGTALLWILMFALAVLTLVGLFKNARRTHLD